MRLLRVEMKAGMMILAKDGERAGDQAGGNGLSKNLALVRARSG